MKVAIVHDFLNQYGGAEKVLEAIHELYPDAPIYTSFYVPDHVGKTFSRMKIITSFMNGLPGIATHFKKYFLIYPFAFRSFDLNGYDVILSSCSSFSKGIRKPKNAVHICYCYTPARFIWRFDQYMEKENCSALEKWVARILTKFLRKWDRFTSRQVDYFVAISDAIKDRIKMIYGRDAAVIYPPVETAKFAPSSTHEDYYLVVSRLNAYKRLDIVIRAFNKLRIPLKIIGAGPHADTLKSLADSSVRFLGHCSNEDVVKHVTNCKAFIFPGEEDFGIAPVEAQAVGRPVVAYAGGGALETIVDGVTGVFFREQTAESLEKAILEMENRVGSFNPQAIRENAVRFDKELFKQRLHAFITEKYQQSRIH
jgi:glycosyltransferase involved in cell wall biosynthesis